MNGCIYSDPLSARDDKLYLFFFETQLIGWKAFNCYLWVAVTLTKGYYHQKLGMQL